MKILITFFLLTRILLSQGEGGETFPDNELAIKIKNVPNKTITFELIPIGTNWAYDGVLNNCNYEVYNDGNTYTSSLTAGSNGYVDCDYNGYEYRLYSEGNYTDVYGCAQSTAGLKPLRTGFYRINVKENGYLKTWAFFDWRDNGFIALQCNEECFGRDMTIFYNGNSQKIEFWSTNYVYHDDEDYEAVLADGDIITYGEWQCNERDFSPFWSEGLVVVPKYNPTTGKFNPYIIWGPYSDPSINIQYYRVYRKYGADPWQMYQVIPSDQFEFVDVNVNLIMGGASGTLVQYYIGGMYNYVQQTSPTNTAIVNTEGLQGIEKIHSNLEQNLIIDYSLLQNYPNPFNPSTNISFSIQNKGRVILKVFDILGNEIETLADGEYQPACMI